MAYGYSEYVALSKDEILKRIPQEDIFELVLGYKPIILQYVTSPLRDDDDPGAWFEWGYNGMLLFKDFADKQRVVRDCFQMIMDKYGLTFREAMQYVNEKAGLGLDSSSSLPVIEELEVAVKQKSEKKETDIDWKPRVFELRDKGFWYDRYGIEKQHLIEDGVFPSVWFKFYSSRRKQEIIIRPDDICYCYTEFSTGHVKIYRPFSGDRDVKWITNCNNNDIGGYDKLPSHGELLVITKSYKDYRVLKNQGVDNVIWFQNEGQFPDMEILRLLALRFKKIVVWFDNDRAGHEAAMKLTQLINSVFPKKSSPLFLPACYQLYSIKDPSDLYYLASKETLIEFLKQKNLIEYGRTEFIKQNTSIMDAPFDTSIGHSYVG